MNIRLGILLLSLAIGTGAAAKDATVTTELRSRWKARHGNGSEYDVVQVTRLSEPRDSEAFLITRGGERLAIVIDQNYEQQSTRKTIRDVGSGEYIRLTYHYSSDSRSRSAFIDDAKRGSPPANLVTVTFEGPRGQKVLKESEMQDASAKAAVRQLVSPAFAAQITRLQKELLARTELAIVCLQVASMFGDEGCGRSSAPVVTGVKPDCDVDASFGVPCSNAQRQRANKAAVHSAIPTRY